MTWEQINAISTIISIAVIIIPIWLIARAIKKNSDRRYELEKYKAETERMKAEAMQKEKENL